MTTIPDGKTAAALETLARERAWRDFLAEVRSSLLVWEIDGDVRAHCEPVVGWLRRLAAELTSIGRPASDRKESTDAPE